MELPPLVRSRQAAARRFGLLTAIPRWVAGVVVACLLAAGWLTVYATGGTQTALPHLFYIPIVLAAAPFGVVGGLVVGATAMLLAGPAMPLDVLAGEPQQVANWLIRGLFFMTIGGLAGSITLSLRMTFETSLAAQLWEELELAAPTSDEEDAATGWAPRILETLEATAFHPVFQPIYALDDGRLLAVEALTRFDGQPPATPDVWFQAAARAGLGVELELATMRAAFEASATLPDDILLSLNSSPQLLTDPRLLHLLDRYDRHKVIIEVTEHELIDDYRELNGALAAIRERGIELAVDDAGAGFASLRHIVRLAPDYIKLDPSLTQNLHNDPIRRPLADCLLQFAHRTGSRIVVEGIESAADLATWRELGAHAGQGFLLGRPRQLPAAVRCAAMAAGPAPLVETNSRGH